MSVLTDDGYKNIYNAVVNKENIKILAKNIANYYISILSQNINVETEEISKKIFSKINNVLGKINIKVIPTNIIEFNFNQYFATNNHLSQTQKNNILLNINSIITILNNSNTPKVFNKNIVESLGYSFEDVYKKEGYFYVPNTKYPEFLSLIKNLTTKNIVPETFASPWQTDIDKNALVINSATQTPTYLIKKYFQNLKNSGGYCDQQTDDLIDIIINACGTTSVAGLIHEILHAIAYNKYENSFESGFNTSKTTNPSGFRKYQLFNEITNEYFTQKVFKQFNDSDFKNFAINKQNNNIYKNMIYLVKNFLDKYELEIICCLLSSNPMQFKQFIGEKNFDDIAESLDKIYCSLDFRFYDNTSVFQFIEKKLQQEHHPLLIDGKLTLKTIVENLDIFKQKFNNDSYVKPIIEEIYKLQNTCNKVNALKSSKAIDIQNIKI